jgi:hypothetical protein
MSQNATNTTPIGLRGEFGCHILDQILERVQVSDKFECVMSKMWGQHSHASGPGQYEMMRDENGVVEFMRNHIFPVIDPNNEAECYFLLNAVKHISEDKYFFDKSRLNDNEIEQTCNSHFKFRYNRAAILLRFLKEPQFSGTLLEQYLRYPLTRGDSYDYDLFSIEGSQASRKWAKTAEAKIEPKELTI